MWYQGGQAESELNAIQASVGEEPTLSAILQECTAPETPEQEAERRENEAWRQRSHTRAAEKEAERRADEETLHSDLQTDRAFSTANQLQTLARLHRWLQEHPEIDDRPLYWNKTLLTAAFGTEVFDRVESASQAFWRASQPILWSARHEGEKNHIYLSTQIGILSVRTEALTPNWTASLASDHVQTAAAYATLELNTFPTYVNDIAKSHPRDTEEVIGGEVSAELRVGGDYDYLRTLEKVTHADRHLKQLCTQRLLTELRSWPHELSSDTSSRWDRHLDSVLRILTELEIEDDREKVTHQCVERYKSNPIDPSALTWLRGIFIFDAEQGVDTLIEQLAKEDVSTVGQYPISAFASLLDRDRSLLFEIEDPTIRARTLGKLLRRVYMYVRPEDDVVHEGVYTPGSREDAEAVRQHFFEMLLATPGPEAHRVLLELADEEPFASWSDRLRMRAKQRAAENAEFSAYSPDDVMILERRYELPPSDRNGLFAVMMDRLYDLADDMAHGDFSDISTVRKITEEPEMQRTLARRLKERANGVYLVTREEEVVDNKELDIRLSSLTGNQKAVIEVKIADSRWSLTELRKALRCQLVGRYLRDTDCRAGCLLLTCHDRNKYWIHPKTRKRIGFHNMVEYMNGEAQRIEEETLHSVRLSVFGLHLDDT